MLPHRSHPVELPRRVRAAAAAAAAGRGLPVLPAALAQLRAHGRPVLPAQHRHRDRLCARRRAPRGRHADGAADHPDRGAARAGGDPQPRPDAGGAAAGVAAGAVPAARWTSGCKRVDGQRLALAERAARSAARPAGAREGARPVRRAAARRRCRAARGWSRRSAGSSWRSGC